MHHLISTTSIAVSSIVTTASSDCSLFMRQKLSCVTKSASCKKQSMHCSTIVCDVAQAYSVFSEAVAAHSNRSLITSRVSTAISVRICSVNASTTRVVPSLSSDLTWHSMNADCPSTWCSSFSARSSSQDCSSV